MDIIGPKPFACEGGGGEVTLQLYDENGVTVCGLLQLTGHVTLAPKAWLRVVRAELSKLEDVARLAGCAEMRVAGRDWSRVLTDYEPLPGPRNGLRKRL